MNDPVAVLLTTVLTNNMLHPGTMLGLRLVGEVVAQFGVGARPGALVSAKAIKR